MGLMEALKEADGAEDLADLAKALQPTNPVLSMELQTELDLALGITPVHTELLLKIHEIIVYSLVKVRATYLYWYIQNC